MKKSANQQPTEDQEPKLVRGKIVSFVRYGDTIIGLSQLGTGIRYNSKTKSFQTYSI